MNEQTRNYVKAIISSGLRARYKYVAIVAAMDAAEDGWVQIDPHHISALANCADFTVPRILATLEEVGWLSQGNDGWVRLNYPKL